jgi:hypothetical protein
MNKTGDFQTEFITNKIAKQIGREKAEELVKTCSITGDEPCDSAYKVYQCFYHESAKY